MSTFDKIIGYTSVKRELQQISDTLRNREIYEKLGVSSPRGLLLHGEPGVGKTLMASAVIETSGRKAFICRKNKPDGEFIKEIEAIFKKAAEEAPSIVFLDDMDKFANSERYSSDDEEFVTVQACIDEVKGKEVFVLATANDIDRLPNSLRRAGRFDRIMKIDVPTGPDAIAIITHYLEGKKLGEGIDAENIARIMDGNSCAELETIINEAGLLAGFERAEMITMEHFMEAVKRIILDIPSSLKGADEQGEAIDLANANSILTQIIYHEAGHVVISEVLNPSSVTLVSVYSEEGKYNGYTHLYRNKDMLPISWERNRLVGELGGMAATEQKFGIFDSGSESDLDQAFRRAKELISNHCIAGFHLYGDSYYATHKLEEAQEKAAAVEVEKYYRKAKEILALNYEFFEKIAHELAQKGLLSAADIQEIKAGCRIVQVAV